MRARHQPFEVIVCENGSTDGTLALARDLADKYPEVVVEHLARADYGAALARRACSRPAAKPS